MIGERKQWQEYTHSGAVGTCVVSSLTFDVGKLREGLAHQHTQFLLDVQCCVLLSDVFKWGRLIMRGLCISSFHSHFQMQTTKWIVGLCPPPTPGHTKGTLFTRGLWYFKLFPTLAILNILQNFTQNISPRFSVFSIFHLTL